MCRAQGRQLAGAQVCYSSREGSVRGLQPMPSHGAPCLRDHWEPPPLPGALCRAATSLMGLESTKIPLKMPKPALRNGLGGRGFASPAVCWRVQVLHPALHPFSFYASFLIVI